ncbi:MAG TPA: ATP-binding protein, partial [Vicinamibacterales bacterium]|nr:ATP-binding protein [Vicinamibacterales bacterium]
MEMLDFAGFALLGITLAIVILMIVVLMRVAKVVSGRSAAQRARAEHSESALLSMALQEALTKLKEQERATAARAEASERLASQIVQGLTSGLVVVDRGGVVQTVNPAAQRILELDRAGVGLPFREVLASAPAMSDVINEALQGASPILRRTIALGKGKSQHLGVTVSPITGADGALQAAVCLFTDLTAVVQLEEQLRLKEALARLGELTAGLAHEFRNGLATIHGYGRLLDPQSLPEQARTCVEGIRAETVALGEVVTNFLKFARPERLALAPVDLKSVITRAVDDLPGAAAFTIVQGSFGTIEGDEVLLRQAFSNLVRNSLEACEAARVTPRITINGEAANGDVRVLVHDNGPGLEPEALQKAFQPFATTKATGTGLGLAIV